MGRCGSQTLSRFNCLPRHPFRGFARSQRGTFTFGGWLRGRRVRGGGGGARGTAGPAAAQSGPIHSLQDSCRPGPVLSRAESLCPLEFFGSFSGVEFWERNSGFRIAKLALATVGIVQG